MADTPLKKADVIAAVERAIEGVNLAVDLQFSLPIDVLGHLVDAQTSVMRALHVAKHSGTHDEAMDRLWRAIARAQQRYEKEARHG